MPLEVGVETGLLGMFAFSLWSQPAWHEGTSRSGAVEAGRSGSLPAQLLRCFHDDPRSCRYRFLPTASAVHILACHCHARPLLATSISDLIHESACLQCGRGSSQPRESMRWKRWVRHYAWLSLDVNGGNPRFSPSSGSDAAFLAFVNLLH